MQDILIVGGMGSGKTTLCKALALALPQMNYIYASQYNVRIPLALLREKPDLFKLSRVEFIRQVVARGVVSLEAPREELDAMGQRVYDSYGPTVFAELALRARKQGVPNCIDSMCKVSNVDYLRFKGIYVVGLDCPVSVRVQRCLTRKKCIDPADAASLVKQVNQTDTFFETPQLLDAADVVYNTATTQPPYTAMLEAIVKRIK